VNRLSIQVSSFTALIHAFIYKLRSSLCPAFYNQNLILLHDAHCEC
jgi:hypothetical protein